MPLTALAIKKLKLKPGEKQKKVSDSHGLILLLHPNGGKYWQYNYRFAGKQKTMSIGKFDDVTLDEAREKRNDAKKLLRNNVDPMQEKKKPLKNSLDHTFKVLAEEWIHQKTDRGESNIKDIRGRFKNHINPFIGNKQISEVTLEELGNIFLRLNKREIHTRTVRKIWQNVFNVYKYAIPLGACKHNLAADVEGLLKSGDEVIPRKALALEDLPLFLKKIDTYNGRYETVQALKSLILTALRPGEIQKATWSEFDLEKREWTIVKKRMKSKREHTIPISSQLHVLLTELYDVTGHHEHLFPNQQNPKSHMSENTLNKAIKSMGFDATAHGMRSLFSSLANEAGFNPDAVERQLAHVDPNETRAAYNRTEYFKERSNMMQMWADYLDKVKANSTADIIFEK